MRLTSKGQVTIPLANRKKSGGSGRGARLVEAMRRAPRPKSGMTTDQLMAFTRVK